MATYSSWVMIFWSIFDACCTSEHPCFSGFEAEKGLRVINACVVYTLFNGNPLPDMQILGLSIQKQCQKYGQMGIQLSD